MVLFCLERPQNRNSPVLRSPSGEMNKPAIVGRKVSSSDLITDLSQRAYFKGAESISLRGHEINAGKDAVEDVFSALLRRYFEENGGEKPTGMPASCFVLIKNNKNKQTEAWPMSEIPSQRVEFLCIVASHL